MKKTLKRLQNKFIYQKSKRVLSVTLLMIVALFTLNGAALDFSNLTPCDNEPGHFIDKSGNAYCLSENPIFDFYRLKNQVCLLNEEV